MTGAGIHFYFDPVCPFAWITSKWVRMVAAQRDYAVDWRFISLRIINSHIDSDSHFPSDYEDGHTSGLRLLRVAARARAALVGLSYAALDLREHSGMRREPGIVGSSTSCDCTHALC